ncbi:MAG: hypothetical protein AAFQ11_12000, partial [Pseudomonadota bacterium]
VLVTASATNEQKRRAHDRVHIVDFFPLSVMQVSSAANPTLASPAPHILARARKSVRATLELKTEIFARPPTERWFFAAMGRRGTILSGPVTCHINRSLQPKASTESLNRKPGPVKSASKIRKHPACRHISPSR